MALWVFVYSPSFAEDLLSIVEYIVNEFDDVYGAEKVLSTIDSAVEQLTYHPLRYSFFPECDDLAYWYVTAGKYVIIFHAYQEARTVNILRVLHSHRDIAAVMKNKDI